MLKFRRQGICWPTKYLETTQHTTRKLMNKKYLVKGFACLVEVLHLKRLRGLKQMQADAANDNSGLSVTSAWCHRRHLGGDCTQERGRG